MEVKLSVVIPCFNEEKRFKVGISHYLDYLSKQSYSWELILVNDGSSDKTLTLMHNVRKINRKVLILSYKVNRGKGYAIVKGVLKAKGDVILFSDLDHAVPIETIEDFFNIFQKGFKVVIGSRRLKGSKLVSRQHPIREFLGNGFTLLVKVLVDREIKDATCGFKAFKKNVAKRIFGNITIYNWAFDAELLYLCKIYKIKLAQAPVAWTDVKGSKVSIARDIISSLAGLIKIRVNDVSGKYK